MLHGGTDDEGSARLSLVHGNAEEMSARLALLHGGTEKDAGCCYMEVLMTLHACMLHGCTEDEMGRRGACMSMGACLLAEYERVVTLLHGSARDKKAALDGSSGDAEMGR